MPSQIKVYTKNTKDYAGTITADDNTKDIVIEKPDGRTIDIEKHADRHRYGAEDALMNIDYRQFAENTIYFMVPVPIPDVEGKNIAVDSTGVKYVSVYRYKWVAKHIKKIRIRAKISTSVTDSTVKVKVVDEEQNIEVVSVSITGSGESEAEKTTFQITDGGYWHVEVEVTSASSTNGATATIDYVVVEIEHGVS